MSELELIDKAILCAANIIEKTPEKWIRGHYTDIGNTHCAVGWIRECYQGLVHDEVQYNDVETYMDKRYQLDGRIPSAEIVEINDNEKNDHIFVANYLRSLVNNA